MDQRVIYKCGFISRHTVEMNMDKIEWSTSICLCWPDARLMPVKAAQIMGARYFFMAPLFEYVNTQ